MIAEAAKAAPQPSLGPALGALTALQAVVALAIFAPGVVAPRTGVDPAALGTFATLVFLVGMVASWYTGMLVGRLGAMPVSQLCAALVALGMAACALPGWAGLILGGIVLGLAFGPETPAGAALLGRLTPPQRRPLVFSVRQTGNQIGAIAGSLALPWLSAMVDPRLSYAAVAGVALLMLGVLVLLAPAYRIPADPGPRPSLAAMVALVRQRPLLGRLAVAAMAFGAMQLALNAFFVSMAVGEWSLPHALAGVVLAVAQAGGLVGRLGWGYVATAWLSPRVVLVVIGLMMSASAIAVALFGRGMPLAGLIPLAGLFGLSASGWNGVFVSELARLAPPGRIAETTGAVLTAAYAGLLAGPAIVALTASLASLAAAYGILAVLCLGGTLLLWRERE